MVDGEREEGKKKGGTRRWGDGQGINATPFVTNKYVDSTFERHAPMFAYAIPRIRKSRIGSLVARTLGNRVSYPIILEPRSMDVAATGQREICELDPKGLTNLFRDRRRSWLTQKPEIHPR